MHALETPVVLEGPRPLPSRRQRLRRVLQSRADDVGLSLGALAAHPLRSALTLLGIVIGVFTVVGMMALTTGLQHSINRGMGGLGASTFQITKWPPIHFGPMDPSIWRRKPITPQQALALRDALPQAAGVGADMGTGGKEVKSLFGRSFPTQVVGGDHEVFANYSWAIVSGRGFNEQESNSGARVIVLGASVADALFPGGRVPLGNEARQGRMKFEVIGVLERQGGVPLGWTPDAATVVPINVYTELFGVKHGVDITVRAHSPAEISRVQDAAIVAFRRIRGLTSQQENDFEIFTNESLRATFDQLAGTVNAATLAICALSLIVGGIGVMNIMLVAVAERTREIGLRKALGARRSRILAQFVIEAVLLAMFGGLFGIGLGYFGSWLSRFAFELPSEVPLWSVLLGLGVSCGIGLVFGIYPAARASRLDPAVALRDE